MHLPSALNHATRLADDGHETTIHVHALVDGIGERTATVRVLKASVPDLAAFLEDAKNDGLNVEHLDLGAGKYFELS